MPQKVKVNFVDHISIAVRDVAKAERDFAEAFGWEVSGRYVDTGEKIRVSYFMVGPTAVEVMEDLDGSGEVAKFIEKHGEGVMVLSFNVDNCGQALQALTENGAKLLDEKPRFAKELNRYFAFLHPKFYHGVLPEIIDGEYK
ncbi:MAG: Glyoxalase/Bleomycin resistance protein/Dioxygenase superfamily protein [Syntrophus sp. PtaB.Bin001]|nr:MAG: Glyoxalase/Bleomycin resistance protein/Dioxygenase superfamily protein [Syntrophus sp. PtaB.Bin001]